MSIPTPDSAPDPSAPDPSAPDPSAPGSEVRVRFCPSPTGTPHVGLIRTALFNWAYARHSGGTFVFRIEDTDVARNTQESYLQLLDALRWLGLDWDEGVEVGGPHGPYRQSERSDIYRDVLDRLLAADHLYESFSSPEEVEARHRAAGRDPKLGYDNADRDLTEDQRADLRAQGRRPVLRLRMPAHDIVFDDLVRGPMTFAVGSTPDFVVARAGGQPLYTLVNPVDDAMMRITHVLRGEDLLSSTARQIALYHALIDIGVATQVPQFGHLPFVLGEGNRKLSKRDPESSLFHHRERGFLPEGLLNYLALLGWSIAQDRDIFSMDEMVQAFDIADVNASPARFDVKKAEAINSAHMRLLPAAEFPDRMLPYLQAAGHLPAEPSAAELALLASAAPLVQQRMTLLAEAPDMLGFLFLPDEALQCEDASVAALKDDAPQVLDAALASLETVQDWRAEVIEQTLRTAIVDGLGIKPKFAFAPVRVAVTGRRVSPPLFESLELLGRSSSLIRLQALRTRLG